MKNPSWNIALKAVFMDRVPIASATRGARNSYISMALKNKNRPSDNCVQELVSLAVARMPVDKILQVDHEVSARTSFVPCAARAASSGWPAQCVTTKIFHILSSSPLQGEAPIICVEGLADLPSINHPTEEGSREKRPDFRKPNTSLLPCGSCATHRSCRKTTAHHLPKERSRMGGVSPRQTSCCPKVASQRGLAEKSS